MKVVESMAINNVDINSFKQQLKGDGIQLVLILGKLFIKHVIPKPLFKINGGSTQIWCLYKKYFFQNEIRNFIHGLFSIHKNKKIETLPKEGPLVSPLEPITLEFKTTIKLSRANWTPTPIIAKKITKTTLTTHLLQNEKHLI